jgi:hypothetical protein
MLRPPCLFRPLGAASLLGGTRNIRNNTPLSSLCGRSDYVGDYRLQITTLATVLLVLPSSVGICHAHLESPTPTAPLAPSVNLPLSTPLYALEARTIDLSTSTSSFLHKENEQTNTDSLSLALMMM